MEVEGNRGAFPLFRASTIWQARAEPMCHFFAWLALQAKAPTEDNVARKNWLCSPQCSLCYCINEANDHILMEYKNVILPRQFEIWWHKSSRYT
jgi:hypothetical protein